MYVATGSSDEKVKLWDAKNRCLLKTYSDPSDTVQSVAFTPDCERLLSGGNDKCVRVYNIDGNNQIQKLDQDQSVYGIAVSPDGRLLAAGGNDNKIKIWDLANY
jgi:WD40 repeat protein